MRARTSASQACGSTSLSFAVWMSVYMRAARSAPRSDPANSHDFLPRAKPRRARSAALFERQILVVADIHPHPTGHRLSLGEDGNRRVVAMQPLGGQDMALDQSVQRTQRRGASADLIGERRQAEVDPFTGVALALPAERLMLAELLEQDHRQQARAGKAARRDMERRRRLGDRLAPPAGEPLPNGLDHLPLTGDNLERLRDVLAELRELRRTAAGATPRRSDHDPLARQILGERFAPR